MKKLIMPIALSALFAFGGFAISKITSNCNCGVKCACAPCNCGK